MQLRTQAKGLITTQVARDSSLDIEAKNEHQAKLWEPVCTMLRFGDRAACWCPLGGKDPWTNGLQQEG